MKYPSTTLINVEDKKIQEEVRKADLDLLSKINEISGGGGETNIFRTTLTTELTEKIRGTVGQKITIWKSNGSGAGEIKLATEDSKKFLWGGAAYDNIYVGLPGQHVTILPEDDGYYIVDGVVQPVALEPDIGGGWHEHYAVLLTGAGFAAPGYVDVDASSLPNGVQDIWAGAEVVFTASGTMLKLFTDNAPTPPIATVLSQYSTVATATMNCRGILRIDASKHFKAYANNTSYGYSLNVYVFQYKLGPA